MEAVENFYPEDFDYKNYALKRALNSEFSELVDEEEFTVDIRNCQSNGIHFIYSFSNAHDCREFTPINYNRRNSDFYKQACNALAPAEERDTVYLILKNIECIDEFDEFKRWPGEAHPYDLTVSFLYPPVISEGKKKHQVAYQFMVPWEINKQERAALIWKEKDMLTLFIDDGMKFTNKITKEQEELEEEYSEDELQEKFGDRWNALCLQFNG
jgi:hypothetical protein